MHTADSLRTNFLSVFDAAEPRIITALGIVYEHEPNAKVYLNYHTDEILLSIVLPVTTLDTAMRSIILNLFNTFQRITADQLTNKTTKENYETFRLANNARLIISWV
jgi:hypothetical protein